jgi:iron complex transport system substrate-binding protein
MNRISFIKSLRCPAALLLSGMLLLGSSLMLTACSGGSASSSSGSTATAASAPDSSAADASSSAADAAQSGGASYSATTSDTSAVSPASGVTVTDMTGRTVTIDEPVTRIVALTPSDCEILYAIGAGDLIVGRGKYCDYPEEVLDIPAVASGADTNIEEIINLDPQVLIMSTMAQTKEQIRMLEDAGIQVVETDAQDIEGVYTAISLLGELTGRTDEAQALCGQMQAKFAELSESAASKADGTVKTVYFEVTPLEQGLYSAGKGTFMNEIAELLGLKNIFDDTDGWNKVSEEQVIDRDPDYIVTIGSMNTATGQTPVEEILSRKAWQNITAVRNGAVLNVPNNEFSRPAPRLRDAAQALYDLVYGAQE